MRSVFVRFSKKAVEKCTGCRTCELSCSFEHEGEFRPSVSRIRIIRSEEYGVNVPMFCRQCEDPPCKEKCPVDAIRKDEGTGAWLVDENLCIGCNACAEACPFGIIFVHPERHIAVKCDLCGGNPQCVKRCVYGVLKFMEKKHFPLKRARERAEELLESQIEEIFSSNQ